MPIILCDFSCRIVKKTKTRNQDQNKTKLQISYQRQNKASAQEALVNQYIYSGLLEEHEQLESSCISEKPIAA